MSQRRQRQVMVMVTASALALGLAACSATGGRKALEERENASVGSAGTPTMTVAMVTHSAPGDTFWDIVRKGSEDAAKKSNVKLEYTADPEGGKQANLVQQAIDKKVDGIAITLAKPEAMASVVRKATAAGIPVVAMNGGMDKYADLGVLSFFGQDERVAGEAAGNRAKKEGSKKPLCVIHEQGNVGHEERCAGVKAKIPQTQIVYVNGKSSSSMQSGITSKLQQDKSIDYVITLGGPIALVAVKAKSAAGSKSKIVTFDTSADVIDGIKNNDIQWAVDQQPYLQGYLAVDQLWLYKNNGNIVGGGKPVLTGPAFVDTKNAASVEKFAASGRR
ncbi:sugar ABC transporter substrate-binding protein [Demetria terragena]|uniref:sugar ABC transporter substrate-binding protein n=1 Tax=Demetria terragena TaxID=63959 RepID=UPI0003A39C7F|nr:sugar ABC transporter substrate-binding protein [Demetria terragena]